MKTAEHPRALPLQKFRKPKLISMSTAISAGNIHDSTVKYKNVMLLSCIIQRRHPQMPPLLHMIMFHYLSFFTEGPFFTSAVSVSTNSSAITSVTSGSSQGSAWYSHSASHWHTSASTASTAGTSPYLPAGKVRS